MTTTQPNFDMSREQAEELADSLARALNAVDIPCVLWGDFLLSLWGVPTITTMLDLVIPDEALAAATQIMTASTQLTHPLVACPDAATCANIYRPQPAFHLHIQGAWDPLSTTKVRLFLQSETLWFLPPFNATLANPRANPLPPYLVFASDRTVIPHYRAGFGNGAFASDQTIVLVPKAEILLEAYMRIMGRDWASPLFGFENVCYMSLYVERSRYVDADLLPAPFGTLYRAFSKSTMPMLDIMAALRRAMGLPAVEITGT